MLKNKKSQLNTNENLEFPENTNTIKLTSNRHKGLFSWALFKENIKSYWGSWSIVSLGNALLVIIVVMILASLNINETKKAMTDMFQNADTESTVKTGVIGLYTGFSQAAETYEMFSNNQKELVNSLSSMYEQIDDSNTQQSLKYVETTYKRLYDIENNHESAKSQTISLVNTYLNLFSSMSNEQKELVKQIIPYYIDEYYHTMNDNTSTKNRLINAIGNYLSDTIKKQYEQVSDENVEKIKNLVISSIDTYNGRIDGINDATKLKTIAKEVSTEVSFEIIRLATDTSLSEQVNYLIDDLKEKYEERKESFIGNVDNYYNESLSNAVIDVIVNSLEDFAYLNYLPSYKVEYITSVRGLPLIKESTGTVDSNGNIIYKEVESTKYEPDKFIRVNGTMGNAPSILEKKNKAIITGKEYSDKEIKKAKEDAKSSIDMSKKYISSFMVEFINRNSENKNAYFDGENIDYEAIKNKSIDTIIEEGQNTIINQYNTAKGTSIISIDELPSDYMGMTGESIIKLLRVYAVSGLSSYNDLYNEYSNKYSMMDAMLVSMSLACKTVTGSLPLDLMDTLTELGNMNTYGFMVGVVAFGMACLLMPLVYTIILSNGLVAEKVETGSLAFTLATPTTRNTFVFTQAVYLAVSEIASGIILFLGAIISREVGIAIGGTDFLESLLLSDILKFALGSVMVIIAMSGICFLSSCIFNKTRYAIGIGGGINIFFFICSILGLFGSKAMPGAIRIDSMDIFNYFTIDSLYDGLAAMNGEAIYWLKLVGLLAISLITTNIGIAYFNKKDLPL